MMDSRETKELATQHLGSVSNHHASSIQLCSSPPLETFLSVESPVPIATKSTLLSPHSKKLVLAQDTLSLPMPHTLGPHTAGNASLPQKLNHILSTATEPEAVLQQMLQALGETFQSDCYLAVNGLKHEVMPQAIYCWQALEHTVTCPDLVEFAQHPALQIVLHRGPDSLCNISDLAAIQSEIEVDWQGDGSPIHALLGSTTRFQGQQNGIVSLARSQPHAWTDTEITTLTSALDQVAIAIAQFHTQRQIQQQNYRQALVDQLTVAIHDALELNQIFKLATAGAAQALQIDRSLMLMLKYSDPGVKSWALERSLRVRATVVSEWCNPALSSESESPILNSYLNEGVWLSECGLCQKAFADSGNLVALTNGYDSICTAQETGVAPLFATHTFPALLMAPLKHQGTILGFLVLQHSQPRPWQAEELKTIELVAVQVSTAIIQSQTLRQVQGLVEERTAQLQRSLEVQAKLYERTRKQIDQLRQLNQLKDEFLSTMSHELLTPLTSMTLAIRMLRQAELTPERQNRYLDILEQQCSQETNLINDLLALQKLESNQASIYLQKVDLKSLIGELVESFADKLASKSLTLATDLPKRSLILQTDYDSLKRILIELLTNASKYAEANSEIRLVVAHQAESQDNQTTLSLYNHGPGIAEEELPYIFDKFRRGQGVTQRAVQGTGLGLALVKCLVQHLSGTITVASSPLKATTSCETCFTLTLPHAFNSANS